MRTKLVYISGGENFAPTEIKMALDEIRQSLGLPDDIVLFGMPVDDFAGQSAPIESAPPAVQDHKILQFPKIGRKSILNVIENPAALAAETETIGISDAPMVVDGDDDDSIGGAGGSITDLLGKLPPISEDMPPQRPEKNLADEFSDFLDKEKRASHAKKAKPFARKKSPFNNLLGDLFNYAGIAANDDGQDFALPDFIKRP
jgi:hypothetical protein